MIFESDIDMIFESDILFLGPLNRDSSESNIKHQKYHNDIFKNKTDSLIVKGKNQIDIRLESHDISIAMLRSSRADSGLRVATRLNVGRVKSLLDLHRVSARDAIEIF